MFQYYHQQFKHLPQSTEYINGMFFRSKFAAKTEMAPSYLLSQTGLVPNICTKENRLSIELGF
jgi:hypothetical protein